MAGHAAVAGLFILAFEVEIAETVPRSDVVDGAHAALPRPGTGCTARLNDRVIAAKIVYRFRDPKRGEIAVFKAPARSRALCTEGGTYLKRVIGLPGEVVSERSGFFYVDGKPLKEPYLNLHDRDSVTKTWQRLGKDEYFMMGDNRIGSCDSRTWGPVPRSAFIGPVVATYWPPNRWTVR
jgi:signal peptidase I